MVYIRKTGLACSEIEINRVWELQHAHPVNLDTSQSVFAYFSTLIDPWQEEVWIAGLTAQLTLIDRRLVFRGTADRCLVHPRDIFRFLVMKNATCFVLVHNHPSGEPHPSAHDRRITKKLQRAGALLEIPMMDHVVLGSHNYFSFADHGILKNRRGPDQR